MEAAADPPVTGAVPPARRSRLLRRLMIYVLAAIVLWVLVVWFVQRTILFPTRFIPASLHVKPGEGVEVIHLTPADLAPGTVESWFIPGRGVTAPGPAVMYAHGNGELIDLWEHDLTGYTDLGVSVMLVEYRGYGRSAGTPTQAGITRDFTAFYDLLAKRPDVDPNRIVLHGRSLGGGAMASLVKERPAAAMVLESTFTDVAAMARRFFVPAVLVRDRFDVRDTLKSYPGPVLIIHGTHDEVIPVAHAHRNAEAAKDARLVVYDGMTHNEPPPSRDYWRDVAAFLREEGIVR